MRHADLGPVRRACSFIEDPPNEDLDGALADLELVRDDLVRLALTQARQDLALARREAPEGARLMVDRRPAVRSADPAQT